MATRSADLHVLTDGATVHPGPRRAPAAPGERANRARALWVLGAVAGLALLGLALLHATSEERALGRLPPAERGALYHRTLDNLRSVCAGDRARELRDFCRGQAELVLFFPECDGACQATAREQLRTPTR
jgi:hypothetical protein